MSSPAPCKTKTEKTMDKKFYFEPELEVVDLELSGMLCASGDDDPVDPDQPGIDDTPVTDPGLFG